MTNKEKQKRLTALSIAGWLVFLGLWLSTQAFAKAVDYHPALGRPLLTVGGIPLYLPYKYAEWYIRLRGILPNVFDRTCDWLLLGLAAGPLAAGFYLRKGRKLDSHGSAAWATDDDIAAAGLLNNDGVILGMNHAGEYLRHDGPEHVIAMAPTRSGKGVGIIIPTLLTWRHSVLVTDIKGENWGITAGYRQQYLNNKVIKFDPTAQDGSSARYNPLQEIRLRTMNEVRDTQNIADMLVDPQGTGQLDHWAKTAHALLVGVILHLMYACRARWQAGAASEPYPTLAAVVAFLSDPDREFEDALLEMLEFDHITPDEARSEHNLFRKIYNHNPRLENGGPDLALATTHPVVASAARDLINKADNERSGVLSTAVSFLTLYRDPVVAYHTGGSDFTISDLMNHDKPVSLYLVVPPSDLSRTRPLLRLFINQVVRRLTETMNFVDGKMEKTYKHRLLLLLDEFPALGNLDAFETALAFIAGYGLKALLIVQSVNQLNKIYTKDNAIVDNCHVRVFYTPNDAATPEFISKMLGKKTIKVTSTSGRRGELFDSGQSTAQQGRELMTPEEVSLLPKDEEIVFVSGFPPIRARKLFYYQDQNFTSRCLAAPARSDTCR